MRIKLEKPDQVLFSTHTKVRVTDLNYGNHLSNDKLLAYAHQARVELFEHWGQHELAFGGVGIIMADAAILFQSEGFLGDELRIDLGVKDISRVGFDLYYQITNIKTGKELALIKTGIICFDYEQKKVVSIPEPIKAFLGDA
jgi:acyl-CoA thioester hydrolase